MIRHAYRVRQDAYVRPIDHRPLATPARLDYRSTAELRSQLADFIRHVWPGVRAVVVDTAAREIIINGRLAARYVLHEPGDES